MNKFIEPTTIVSGRSFALSRIQAFIKNPIIFFQKCKDDRIILIPVATMFIRIEALVGMIVAFVQSGEVSKQVMKEFLTLVLAKPLAYLLLIVGGAVIDMVVKLVARKANIHAAERVAAYSYIANIIGSIPVVGIISLPLIVILRAIGIAKQYKLGYVSATIAAAIPTALIFGALWFIKTSLKG